MTEYKLFAQRVGLVGIVNIIVKPKRIDTATNTHKNAGD